MPKTFKFLKWSGNKAVALFVLTIVLAVAAVGSTVAYIVTKTGEVTNTFTPPNLDIEINVANNEIENAGDVPVYVRAAIVANWVDEDGTILSTQPSVTYSINAGWEQGSDGFYYYTGIVPAHSNNTVALLAEDGITVNGTAPSGYTLQVQVLSSAIQTTPTEAVINGWTAVIGVDPDTGKLTIAK